MELCTIGGTGFSGRAFVGQALDAGHAVTVFHRGRGEEDPWPAADHVHGDRDGGLGAVDGRRFDAVVDFCAYVPRHVREALETFRDAGRYVFISSISAHRDNMRAGATEDDDVWQPPYPDTEDVTWETYGPLKVACERAAVEARGDATTIVRPHYIVGPHDPTDRFTYWVRRAAAGGRMLAPSPADQPMQWIDARDLAAFLLRVCTDDVAGTYGVATPARAHTLRELLDVAAAAGGASTEVVWCDDAFIRDHDLHGTETSDPFPLITPEEPNAALVDAARAVAHGLTHRPLEETVADTLAWDRARGAATLRAGLSAEREAALLAAWDGR